MPEQSVRIKFIGITSTAVFKNKRITGLTLNRLSGQGVQTNRWDRIVQIPPT